MLILAYVNQKDIHKTESKQRSTARGTDQARNEFRFILSLLGPLTQAIFFRGN